MDALDRSIMWDMAWVGLLERYGLACVKLVDHEQYGRQDDVEDARQERAARRQELWAHLAKSPATVERDAAREESAQFQAMYVAMVARADGLRTKLDALREAMLALDEFLLNDESCSVTQYDEFKAAIEASREATP